MFEISEHKRNLFFGLLHGHDIQVHGLSWEHINTHGSYFNILLTSLLRSEFNLLLKDDGSKQSGQEQGSLRSQLPFEKEMLEVKKLTCSLTLTN